MDLRAFEQLWDGKSSENLKQSDMICFLSEQDHRGCWVGRQEILGHGVTTEIQRQLR